MAEPRLFTPLSVGGLVLPNRIVVSPMCQYSAENGRMTDWHLMHLGQLALSGAGLLIIEAAAVSPEGRITFADVGLWDDATEAALNRVLDAVRRISDIPVAIQLAHAGRKASCARPWEGGGQLAPTHPQGWRTLAPSAIAFNDTDAPPEALDRDGLTRLRDAFAASARRAARIGLDGIQIHAAHGYLLHQFLSPLSNTRTDRYGGDPAGRIRFPLEVFEAVREAFPADRPVSVRVSATDWVENGWDTPDTVAFARELAARGCAAINVSGGGLHPAQRIPVGPSYQVPHARAVKQAVEIPVVANGLITGFNQAESILEAGDADAVGLARGLLHDPRWPWHAAEHFGATVQVPPPYLRAAPHGSRATYRPGPVPF